MDLQVSDTKRATHNTLHTITQNEATSARLVEHIKLGEAFVPSFSHTQLNQPHPSVQGHQVVAYTI